MPMSPEFENRLLPILDDIVNYYETPFHIYDETGIRQTGKDFMAALMRPAIYGAYHHITVVGKQPKKHFEKVDVVGSLCENNDKFAILRLLPEIEDGDRLLIHDTGAHGHAMGFNYNGRLRPKELLLRSNGTVDLIRREETLADYFATLNFAPQVLVPNLSAKRNAA